MSTEPIQTTEISTEIPVAVEGDDLLTYAAQMQGLVAQLAAIVGELPTKQRGPVGAIVAAMQERAALVADRLKPPPQPHVTPPGDAA